MTRPTRTFTADFLASVEADWQALRKWSKPALKAEYKRSHRVCDLREFSKGDLRGMVLRARHGHRAVDAWMEVY